MDNEKPYEIFLSGKISYNDYKMFNRFHLRKLYIKKFIALFFLYCMMFYGLSIITISFMGPVSMIILSLFLSLLTVGVLILITFKRLKSIYYSNKRIQLEKIYSITKNGTKWTDARGESVIKWEDIVLAAECKELILIYISIVQALIIPKRFFKSNDDFVKFKNLIEQKISTEKIKMDLDHLDGNNVM
ncbi:MAG: hypothetical protein GQ576_05420 [Methanococcoides sp.]|nr:hypothetical protein [Methanococcoides sp.]